MPADGIAFVSKEGLVTEEIFAIAKTFVNHGVNKNTRLTGRRTAFERFQSYNTNSPH
jgi:hypothetical protein